RDLWAATHLGRRGGGAADPGGGRRRPRSGEARLVTDGPVRGRRWGDGPGHPASLAAIARRGRSRDRGVYRWRGADAAGHRPAYGAKAYALTIAGRSMVPFDFAQGRLAQHKRN